jgi:glycosyltransferase involved in cell wall biosynthesis
MRVGIDGRSLVGESGRGVARVTFEFLAAMAARYPQDEWLVLLPGRGEAQIPAGTTPHRTRAPGRILFGSAALAGRPRLDRVLGGVDVVWLPAPAPVAISRDVPVVLTLHDLSWIERPGDFTTYERLWHRVARARSQARRARWIATNSEHTRRSALKRWPLDPARVIAIPPPLPACPEPPARSRPEPDPYFLWVGALEPRKAPEIAEAGWREARGRGLAARLVVVGQGRASLSGPGVVHRNRVDDHELCALYRGALALVMPSWLEGAGLPPLEAALCGTPSICSDLDALRASLGPEGARWVAPGDVPGLAQALLELAADPALRARIASAANRMVASRADPGPPADHLRALLASAAGRD